MMWNRNVLLSQKWLGGDVASYYSLPDPVSFTPARSPAYVYRLYERRVPKQELLWFNRCCNIERYEWEYGSWHLCILHSHHQLYTGDRDGCSFITAVHRQHLYLLPGNTFRMEGYLLLRIDEWSILSGDFSLPGPVIHSFFSMSTDQTTLAYKVIYVWNVWRTLNVSKRAWSNLLPAWLYHLHLIRWLPGSIEWCSSMRPDEEGQPSDK